VTSRPSPSPAWMVQPSITMLLAFASTTGQFTFSVTSVPVCWKTRPMTDPLSQFYAMNTEPDLPSVCTMTFPGSAAFRVMPGLNLICSS
jgi:hypothetical protein